MGSQPHCKMVARNVSAGPNRLIGRRLPKSAFMGQTFAVKMGLAVFCLLGWANLESSSSQSHAQTLKPRLPGANGPLKPSSLTFRPIVQEPTPLLPPSRSALDQAKPLVPSNRFVPQNQSLATTKSDSSPARQKKLQPLVPSLTNKTLVGQQVSTANHLPYSEQLASRPEHIGHPTLRKSNGNLYDVHFIDHKTGIAVGAQGLIWRTIDGGAHWNPCVSPTQVDLVAVTFADAKQGWAAGGVSLPVKGLHRGVVLKTTDGGMTWNQIQTTLLPRLVDIQTTADHRLWATAIATHQFPQRVFESLDGGHSWNHLQFQWPKSEPTNTQTLENASHSTIGSNAAWYDGSRSVIATTKGIISVADDKAIYSDLTDAKPDLHSIRSIAKSGRRLYAVADDGSLLVSLDQGDRWMPLNPSLPPQIATEAQDFVHLTANGESLWVTQNGTGRILHGDLATQQWCWQTLPTLAPIHSLHFIDKDTGWAVGPLGNVLRTMDAGQHWTWEHSLHSHLAVLVVANNSADIPPALLAQLSANNHLNVGVLVGETSIPAHVFHDSLSQLNSAWIDVNPKYFDSQKPTEQLNAIQGCLAGVQPQILLVCPTTTKSKFNPIIATTWIGVAQKLRQQLPHDAKNPWGVMGQTVLLAETECDSSASLDGYAPALQRLLGDAAHYPMLLQQQWTEAPHPTARQYRKSIGVRRLAAAGSQQLSWFSSVARLEPNSIDSFLSRFIGQSRPAPLFNLAQQASYKQTWIASFASATTDSRQLRSEWLRNLTATLSQVPEQSRVTWLLELAEQCEHQGDVAKATLAYLEAWNFGTDDPAGLYGLVRAIPRIISDEAQWSNRREALELAQQEMLAMDRRIQAALEQGLTTEEARFDEALRRWGIDPANKDQIPPNIIAKIEALEKLRESKNKQQLGEKEESLIEIPNFQTFANVATPKIRNFDDKDGNKVTKQSTVVQWSTADTGQANVVSQATHFEPNRSNRPDVILDQLPDARIAHAYQLTKLADGLWPHLQSDARWWKFKACIAREMGDIPRIESAWNRYSQYQSSNLETEAIVQFEKLIGSMGSQADEASLFANSTGQIDSDFVANPFNWHATWADQRPQLDGKINEAIWDKTIGNSSTKLAMSHDEQYLYLAISSTQPNKPDKGPRAANADSARRPSGQPNKIVRDTARESDAILVHIDTDRDYETDFVLIFDTAGRVTERQGADSKWNPTMFVAQEHDGETWILEVAIDLADVSLPQLGQYWHMRVQRNGDHPNSISGWTRIKDPLQILPN